MIKHPEDLKKAQEEVDSVCGSSRSPTLDDIDHLPFIKACMDEVIVTFLEFELFLTRNSRHLDGVP
jgi:hypothetical protein